MSLPVYMYEDNYHGRPWNRKSVPQQQTRRISFDSFVERPKMHSRTPSIDSSISSLSSGRNRLQKKTKHNSTPPSWSLSSSPSGKPLPSLPIWHSQYDVSSEAEYRQRMARAAEAQAAMVQRDRQMAQEQQYAGNEKLSARPSMPDFGDSWVMDRPRRRGTYSGKKGWRFYREAFTNFRNRNKST